MVKVKVCGLTNLVDAQWAAKCGADALGFILSKKGPRFISEKIAASIISQLPPFTLRVGVLVDEEIETLQKKVADKYGYNLVDRKLELYGVKKKS